MSMDTHPGAAEVVGFGMLTPVAILVVERLPEHNTGVLIQEVSEFIFDDAAIVACLLRQWDIRTGLIGTTVGNDSRGKDLARKLKALGVLGKVRFSKKFQTPFEVDVSDQTGARTYFWQRQPQVLATLDTADLSLLTGAQMLYVDWYDGDHILRAMDAAILQRIPVFLNLEYGHVEPEKLARYAPRATICQAVTDAAQKGQHDPLDVAQVLLEKGVKTALITLAEEGCLAVDRDQVVRAWPPPVKVIDGCGAGATFSAGFIYGYLQGWNLEESVRYAIVAASLKVAHPGLQMAPIIEIRELASKIQVEVFSW
jgi:sugar/nucleoside kinase (ribokinase family)